LHAASAEIPHTDTIEPLRASGGRAVALALLQPRCYLADQAVSNRSSRRAGERGGARAGKPGGVSILTITAGFSMAAMFFKLPPHGMISRAFLAYSSTTVADTIMNIAATQK